MSPFPDENRCPSCFAHLQSGYACEEPACLADATDRSLQDLPLGATLDNKYQIGRVLGRGGFGITYLAWDLRLQHRQAIKECFPQGLVRRSRDAMTVLPTSDRTREQYATIRDLFLREARVLAHFHNQPGIVSVSSILDTNGSAYLVMEYLEGQTLKEYLEAQPDNRIDFEEALGILDPIMDALIAIHHDNWLHRDISPDNIFVPRRGVMKLLDFGAARLAAGQQSRSLPVILKEGYAPPEQYTSKGKQGTWTDVYALAATFYRAITGVTPPPALDRREDDDCAHPSSFGINLPTAAEAALLNGLAINLKIRTQTVSDFRSDLKGEYLTEAAQEPILLREVARPHFPTDLPIPDPDLRTPPVESGKIPSLRPRDGSGPKVFAIMGILLVIASGLGWYFLSNRTTSDSAGGPGPTPGTLVIDAVPWARVEAVRDANGVSQPLTDSSTPLAMQLAAGDYRVVLTGPPPASERREIDVTVNPNMTFQSPVVRFSEIRADEYLREQVRRLASAEGVVDKPDSDPRADVIQRPTLSLEQIRQVSGHLADAVRHQSDGEYGSAIEKFEMALKIDPANARAASGIAEVRKTQAAEAAILDGLRKKPGA